MVNKKALLIGLQYPTDEHYRLPGSYKDVDRVQDFLLTKAHYCEKDIVVLLDDPSDPQSSRDNILREIDTLVSNARRGDYFFFYFSGHGTQIPDKDGDERTFQDSALIIAASAVRDTLVHISGNNDDASSEDAGANFYEPCLIKDDEIHERLVQPLPEGCFLTALFDTCHSGTVMDLPFEYNVQSGRVKHQGVLKALGFYLHEVEQEVRQILGKDEPIEFACNKLASVCASQPAACTAATMVAEMVHHLRHASTTRDSLPSSKIRWLDDAISHLANVADVARAKKDVLQEGLRPRIVGRQLQIDRGHLHWLHGTRARLHELKHIRDERSSKARVISISACKDDRQAEVALVETVHSEDSKPRPVYKWNPNEENQAGVLTSSFLSVLANANLEEDEGLSYADLVLKIREETKKKRFSQKAQLSSGYELDIKRELVAI